MGFFACVGIFTVIYYLIYIILPWFLDCDIKLAFYEKFGKPISSLRGKVVWITGASAGIGENLAYVLAGAGCKLILSARRGTELERVKANCLKKNPNLQDADIQVQIFDVCNLDSHQSIFDNILNKFGTLDILVNNAGRSQRATWENIELAVDKEMFELNVFSHISLSRLVAKYFLKVGKGHFVVTSSLAGVNPVPYSATYCGTKFALHGYFYTFALENLDKHIPVTMVCPGPIQTNFLAESFTEKSGEKYGVATETSKTKLSALRCGELMAVAIANELYEVWITNSLVLQIVYLTKYYPNFGIWIIKLLGPKYLQNLRDCKTIKKNE